MRLIGENIHIISKKTREAIENRDADFIQNLALSQLNSGAHWLDLNIGPARRGWEGSMEWLISIVSETSDINKPVRFSFDTTNYKETEKALKAVPNPEECIINSTSAEEERLKTVTTLAVKYNCSFIALTMTGSSGIPKSADERVEIAFSIVEEASAAGIDNSKILIDPLVLPVSVSQSCTLESLNSIRMFKESFDPPVLTTIGLSNVSNGSPKEMRSLINRVYLVMAMGCGLDTAIVDVLDTELVRTVKVIENNKPEDESDSLLLKIYENMRDFGDPDDIKFNSKSQEETEIYKTVKIILNKEIYAHKYLG
jgi:5-methyltetrahydrofolate corrinoid/iron sulfur protein methyltransferase